MWNPLYLQQEERSCKILYEKSDVHSALIRLNTVILKPVKDKNCFLVKVMTPGECVKCYVPGFTVH